MNENLPQKYKDGILNNIFRKLRYFFIGTKHGEETYQKADSSIEKTKSKLNFLQDVKFETEVIDKKFQEKKLMEELKIRPELLENFSEEKLEEILQYYLEENKRKRELIRKLSNQE